MNEVPMSNEDLQTLLDVAEGYAAEHGLESAGRYAEPRRVQKAIHNAKAAIKEWETGKNRLPETITTPSGNEVHLYDMERFHSGFLPNMEFMDELLAAGYSIRNWEDLADEEIGEVADRLNLYPHDPDWISPEPLRSPGSAQELAEMLQSWLIAPEPEPRT